MIWAKTNNGGRDITIAYDDKQTSDFALIRNTFCKK